MSKNHKEKHLQATNYKIKNIKRQQNFLLKNIWKVVGFGILFTFCAPFYSSSHSFNTRGRSISEINNYSYLELCLICGLTFTTLCFIYHFSSKYQDNKKLTKLLELKKRLGEEIQQYN